MSERDEITAKIQLADELQVEVIRLRAEIIQLRFDASRLRREAEMPIVQLPEAIKKTSLKEFFSEGNAS